MAVVNISEYKALGADANAGTVPAVAAPAITVQDVTPDGVGVASAAFNPATRIVTVVPDVAVYIGFDVDPQPADAASLIPAGTMVSFCIPAGNNMKLVAKTA